MIYIYIHRKCTSIPPTSIASILAPSKAPMPEPTAATHSLNYGENIVQNATEYAGNYEIYKKNIPTLLNHVNLMILLKKMEIKKAEKEQRKNGQINNKQENDSSLFEEKQDLSELPKSLQARIQEASVFFDYNMANDTHCPRALIMDLEPNVIDDVKNSA